MLQYSGKICVDCNSDLKTGDNKTTKIVVYGNDGSSVVKHIVKVCTNKSCRNHYHFSHFTRKNVFFKGKCISKFFYDHSTRESVILMSNSTAFKVSFLRSLMTDMAVCPEYSFQQKATAYNIGVPSGNVQLCPKRLMEAFLLFTLLDMMRVYQPSVGISSLPFSFDLDENLLKFTPTLKNLFQSCYAEHRCNVNGCGSVLGWDADCKVSVNSLIAPGLMGQNRFGRMPKFLYASRSFS